MVQYLCKTPVCEHKNLSCAFRALPASLVTDLSETHGRRLVHPPTHPAAVRQ